MIGKARRRVAVVDFGMGNLFSVARACEHSGLGVNVTADPDFVAEADGVILPGVGAFGDAMATLAARGLTGPIREAIEGGRPFMGVCLGMQLLLGESEEFGAHAGLNVIPGKVVRFPGTKSNGTTAKVPQVGWNRIYCANSQQSWIGTNLEGIADGEFMYFVHSYYCIPDDAEVCISWTEYQGTRYCSSVLRDNLFACQFHPEKSGTQGLRVYENFARAVLALR
jgi:glutamine amidotransferase